MGSASQSLGYWPFGFVIDDELVKDLEMAELSETDILFGFNDGDAFQWANDEYNRLNKHPFGIRWDEDALISYMIEHDFLKQSERSLQADLELLRVYSDDAESNQDDRYQINLRRTMVDFFTDEGFIHPIHHAAMSRDFVLGKTFVYKFAVPSCNTDIARPLMVNSPRPCFAGAIRNDESDFIFKYFGSYPSWMERTVDEGTIRTQNTVAAAFAKFITSGSIDLNGFKAKQYKDGHCLIQLNYDKELTETCDYRKEYLSLWDSIVGK